MHDYTDPGRYRRWVASNDTLTHDERAAALVAIRTIDKPPVFSLILIPAIGIASDRMLRSLMAQLYPFWEVWVSEHDRPDWATDARIKTMPASEAKSGHLRFGIEQSSGAYILPVTSDVSLAQIALYEMYCAMMENTNSAIFYSDEDRLDEHNARCFPWLKTDWDPDLMLARNMIGQIVMYRRDLLMRISFASDPDPEAQLYALALAATWSVVPSRIAHVAKLLAHRSIAPAYSPNMRSLVQRFLRDHGIDAELSPAPLAPHFSRVRWTLPSPAPRVTVIIPTRDRANLLARSSSAVLERTDYANLELLVVDNDTVEPEALAVLDKLRTRDNVRVLPFPGTFNYAAMNNRAAAEASGDVIVMLNNDTDVINSDWLGEIVAQACRPDVGVVGARLLYEDGRVQHAGIVFNDEMDIVHQLRLSDADDPGANAELALVRTVQAVTGACLGIRKDVFFEIGQMDEAHFPVGFNDIDLCLRAGDYGYRVVITPFAELVHLESATLGGGVLSDAQRNRYMAERTCFHGRWASVASMDAFHNRNLSYGWQRTALATPPRKKIPVEITDVGTPEEVSFAALRWSRTLQRLAASRGYAVAALDKERMTVAIARGSEATALQQRDAAERARMSCEQQLVALESEFKTMRIEYQTQIKLFEETNIHYHAIISSNTWKVAKLIQKPAGLLKRLRLRA